MDAIQALQKMDDRALRAILLAVIANETEQIARVGASLKIDPKVTGYLVIAEAANRWLKNLPN